MSLDAFHPAVASWFASALGEPTEPQRRAWPAIRAGRHALIAAPTGSGKTLAAFLAAIDDLVREAETGPLPDETRVVYVSPLKALSNDVRRNLGVPLAGIRTRLAREGADDPGIRTLVRTGDTPASERAAMTRRPPHLFVTTPESLYILLTSEGGRRMLRTARTVIVDEIHALVRDKRGSHLALSLERLDALAGRRLVRIGLSATQNPIEEVGRFLVGTPGVSAEGAPDCTIVDTGHRRALDLALELPGSPLSAVMSGEVWQETYDRLAELVREHRTTLVFVNTRRVAERVAKALSERLDEGEVTSHHGSLSREHRFDAERRLKDGRLRALVATASLELGIDIGDVDLVCQLGTTPSIATLLQRVGRSGHGVDGLPKGRLFPLSRDELVAAAALLDSVRRGELDRVRMPEEPLDILAQQLVASVAAEDWSEDDLHALCRRAWPFRALSRERFDDVVDMVSTGFATRRGRRGALLHHDGVNGRLRARKGARLTAMTSGGAIPDNADYDVLLEPDGTRVGTLNEDFAIESNPGDIFQLGNTSWRILRIEPGRVRVEDARGLPPTIPFWLGEAPSRSAELSASVSRLRSELDGRLDDPEGARAWLEAELSLDREAADQIVEYLGAARRVLGVLPTQDTIVAERFFDETGGMQLVLHSPFGGAMNRAWGLALRKRFCRAFNFELQAAATEDAIVLSLGETHSFPLEDVFSFLHPGSVRDVLTQALLDAPVFPTRFRWNASRALAIPRFRGGRKVPASLQRMQADDLVAVVFPDQLACLENIAGDREIPDHPLVQQTVRDCLEEATDVAALEALLEDITGGRKTLRALDLPEPSPLSAEILGARPYAFLDDAPLEERRTQAVYQRRGGAVEPAAATLDPDAVALVRAEAWPRTDDADELHDALAVLGALTRAELDAVPEGLELLDRLATDRRAAVLRTARGHELAVAAERLPELLAVHPEARLHPAIEAPARAARRTWSPEAALTELVRSRLSGLGPTTAAAVGAGLGVSEERADAALLALEAEGFVLRGRFERGVAGTGWCERRLLARIQRHALRRLRAEIAPVTAGTFVRFLLAWQRVDADRRGGGQEALPTVLEQLEGWEAAASAWEADLLPSRLRRYDRPWLDALCLSGRFAWGRLRSDAAASPRAAAPVRTSPLRFVPRDRWSSWQLCSAVEPAGEDVPVSTSAAAVRDALASDGASFLPELVSATGLLPAHVQSGLAELVGAGLASCDSFDGLRKLLAPASRKRERRGRASAHPAGRWHLVRRERAEADEDWRRVEEAVETVARALLRRHGVVFRAVLERETGLPPWRHVLRCLRRLEARGEVRGGRFVDRFTGEQFALPEAVGLLRGLRRRPRTDELVSVSACDPLNVVGILVPGPKVPAVPSNRILFRGGVPAAVLSGGRVELLEDLSPIDRWAAEKALRRQPSGLAREALTAGTGRG